MVTATVDIAALKARHPLGDVVDASGVRLRGRGRVRQGVCPFHDEAEGSFTVYADTERFYCFGCGAGGDVLDFIRRVENLSLPPSSRTAASQVRRACSPRPRPADGGGAVLRLSAPARPRRLGVPGLAGRRPVRGSPPRPRLCAGQRAAGGS